MSRPRRGIFIANDGRTVDDNDFRYASDKPHVNVSMVADPRHFDVLEFSGGTAFSMTAGSPALQREELITPIRHNLPYTPEVFFYFYVAAYGGNPTHSLTGRYITKVFVLNAGAADDLIYAEVDRNEFRIIHELRDVAGATVTSDAPQYLIRMKYYITSLDSRVEEYNTMEL